MMVEYNSREVNVWLNEGLPLPCFFYLKARRNSTYVLHGNIVEICSGNAMMGSKIAGSGKEFPFKDGRQISYSFGSFTNAQVPQRKDDPHKQRHCRRSDMFADQCLKHCLIKMFTVVIACLSQVIFVSAFTDVTESCLVDSSSHFFECFPSQRRSIHVLSIHL